MFMPKSRATVLLVVILAAGAALRLNNISQPFIDIFSWRQSSVAMMADNFYRGNWNILYPEVSWAGPGPTYQGREFQTITYLAALLYRWVGQQDWVGRILAVICGIWGILALYKLVERVWDTPRAIAAASLMAIVPGVVFVDRSFLPDPVMVSLVTTSLWLWVAFLQTQQDRYLVGAVLTGLLGFLTKLPGMLVGLPMAYAILVLWGLQGLKSPRRLYRVVTAGLVMTLPVIAYYLWARHLSMTYPPYHFAGSGNWLWKEGLAKWVDHNYYLGQLHVNLVYWLWGGAFMALLFFGFLFPPRNGESERQRSGAPIWIFHVWLLGCGFFYLIGAREITENPWNLHIFNPPAAALAGHGLIVVGSFRSLGKIGLAGLARIGLILAAILFYTVRMLPDLYKPSNAYQSYRMGLALRELTSPGDLVVTVANDIGDPVAIYYSRRRGWVFPPARPHSPWGYMPDDDALSVALYDDLRDQGARWFAVAGERVSYLRENHTVLFEHIEKTSQQAVEDPNFTIYRLMPGSSP